MPITYIQNIRNIKNVTLHKSFFGVFLFALLFGLLPFANSDFLKGELFISATEDSLSGSTSVFDITDYSAEAGETGEISIIATQDVDPILGFSLNIDFSSAGMQYNGISTEGTVLDGKNFFIQGNDNTDDILSIAAATGDSGVSISAGDILAKISFTLNQSIPSSTSSLALDIENMKIIGTDMIEKSVSGGEGIISILHPENTLDIQSFEMSANGSLEIVFSELVSDITLDDITFIPDAVTDFSTVAVVGDTVTFSRLDFAGGEQYSLSFLPSFLGQNGDAVSESLTTLTFHVPHDSTPIFTITDTAIISNTEIKISFSEAVKESSIELNDFLSKTLAFEDFTVSEDKKSILVTLSETTVISDLVHPDPLSIEYVESESGKPLKGYLTDVFNYTGLGPQMTHSVRNSEESITVFFENALLESSIDISSFELFKFTNVNECPAYPNLIDENTVMSVAEDGLSITFSGLSLRNIEEYVIMIEAETVQDREGDTVAYHQLKRVQNTVAEQYDEDFFISSLEVLSDVSLQVTLSKEPDVESVNALYASIENALEDLTITSLVQNSSNKKIIDITTSVQTPNTPYVLQFDPQYWKTTAGDILGGKNSFLFTSGEETLVFSLQSVSPYRFIQGVTEKLTIEGANIPDTFSVYAGTYELTKKNLSADKKTLTLSVPDNILEGVYDLKFKWSENEVDKVLDFPEAFIVEEEDIDEIIVISEKSYASPEKVKNDGSDTTTLYVYIDDTRGLADLEKVSVDLRELDGAAAVSLTAGAVENGMQVWILENITVPETVPTSTTPYKLPIIAQNQSGLHDAGYVSVWVSRDTTSSIAPVITSFSITPNIATPADSDHPLLISSEIKDEDGGEDITTVAVDLSPVQLNTIFLTPRNQGQESAKTRFFESTEDIVIPESVADGEYSITLTAIDAQGEETKSTIPLTVKRDTAMGPSMSSGDSYVTPSNKILKDGIFSFQIHTKVTDPSGADNITSVSANLSDLGLPPVALTGGVIEGRSQWFSSSSLIVPDSAMVGKREIVITATDKEGNDSVHDIDVQVLYSAGQGRSPVVESDQNYITPVEVLNDGESTFAAYIFVKDLDSDVSHVVLKLGNTALFAGNELPLGTSSKTTQGEEQCVSTRTLLCMQPIMKESTGQWYYLSDLVITKTTPARDKPYELEVLAVDSNGNTGEGTLSIPVRTVSTLLQDGTNTVTVAQSISSTEIQVLFERAIDPVSVKKDAFVLSFAEDKNSLIPITDMIISPDGKVVTLKTNPQEAGKNYALTMDPESIGLSFESLADTVFSVPGFDSSNASKALKLVHSQSVSAEEMSLTFSDPIDAMSILNTENFQIITSGTKEILEITSLEMSDKYTISLKTAAQSAGASYDLYYKNISSIYGDIIDKRKTVKMDAYKAPLGEGLAQLNGTADFNSDGIVDFTDFTLFAAVYGKTYEESASGDLNGDTTVDFSDFTLFSSQYGDVLDPNGDSGNDRSTTDNMHGSATAITDGNTTNPSSGIGGSTSQATRPAPTALVYSATPSPAPTPTITSTSTPTPTATSTATASPTPLATGYTFTSTPTPTATATSTQTATPTPSSTVSPTASASATPTVSATPSPSDDGSDLGMECTDDPLVCLLM